MKIQRATERRGDRRAGVGHTQWQCQHLEETARPGQRPVERCGQELVGANVEGRNLLYCKRCGRLDRRSMDGSRRESIRDASLEGELRKIVNRVGRLEELEGRAVTTDDLETLARRMVTEDHGLEQRLQAVEERLSGVTTHVADIAVAGEAAAAKVVELGERLGQRAVDSDETLQELQELRNRIKSLEDRGGAL